MVQAYLAFRISQDFMFFHPEPARHGVFSRLFTWFPISYRASSLNCGLNSALGSRGTSHRRRGMALDTSGATIAPPGRIGMTNRIKQYTNVYGGKSLAEGEEMRDTGHPEPPATRLPLSENRRSTSGGWPARVEHTPCQAGSDERSRSKTEISGLATARCR